MLEGYELGADYYISKPANKKQVVFAIENILKEKKEKVYKIDTEI